MNFIGKQWRRFFDWAISDNWTQRNAVVGFITAMPFIIGQALTLIYGHYKLWIGLTTLTMIILISWVTGTAQASKRLEVAQAIERALEGVSGHIRDGWGGLGFLILHRMSQTPNPNYQNLLAIADDRPLIVQAIVEMFTKPWGWGLAVAHTDYNKSTWYQLTRDGHIIHDRLRDKMLPRA